MRVHLTVNGQLHETDIPDRMLLVHYLRDALNLTGTHIGCETSLCGACTVLDNGQMHPIQDGFWEEHGLQCGYCTPGMMMTAVDLLARNVNPTEDEIRHAIEGNLCRCTGYQHIINAIQNAAEKMRQA